MKKTIYGLFVATLLITGAVFANDYYNHSGIPATGSPGSSSQMRAEFSAIESGFSSLPNLTGNANKAVVVDGGGTSLTVTTGGLALGGNFTISGAFATTLTVTTSTNVTLPASGTLATRATAETFTNKLYEFPATQVTSLNANTLDDYEEGTWTPNVGGSATYTTQEGFYVKVGRMVMVTCNMTINAIGTGSATTISGLPFTTDAGTSTGALFWSSAAVSPVYAIARLNTSSTSVLLQGITAAGATISTLSMMGSGTNIRFSSTYMSQS